LERKTKTMYLYSAIVDRVIDGDTLLLRVDLGFEVWINQRIRLRGIDCPEVSTPEGQKAKEFVENRLKNCFIVVIQTFKKIDVHGRYVCDLFYLEDETDKELIAEEGAFLNQELLDEGLAVLI
jgi:endonuclease YncB( thermonuclease family)